jgi:hypothetical protein
MTPLETLKSEVADLFRRRETAGVDGMQIKIYYIWTAQIAKKLEEYAGLLEAELADRPVVWAIQQIETKKLVKKFGAVLLFQTKEDVERYIPTGFIYAFEWHAVVYKGEARWFDNGISNGGWKSLTANGRTTNDTA